MGKSLLLLLLLPALLAGQIVLAQTAGSGPGSATVSAQESAENSANEPAALARELRQRETAVEELRGEVGGYHPALQEAYGELAGFYLQIEDYQQSLASYSDALEVARINEGLYSESQLRIIDAMIRGNEGLTDWPAVDDLHHFRYHMASRLWELTDQRNLAAIDAWGGWKMRAIREGLLNEGSWGLQTAVDDVGAVYRRAIAALEQEGQEEQEGRGRPLALASLVRSKAELDIYMMGAVASTPYSYFAATVPRYINQMRCRAVRGPNGQPVQQCVNVQVENPRYRDSQRNSKRTTLTRYSNAISNGIERLTVIRDSGNGLSGETIAEIDAQIAQLEAQYREYTRRGRRDFLF